MRRNIVRILTDVRFSVWPSQSQPWERVLSLIRYADDNGWYGAWVADHFMPSTYSSPTVQDNSRAASGDVTECFSLLSAAAAVTQKVRLGSLVAGNTYRHPAIVAKQASAIDQISGGRFVLGLGAGWQQNEHDAYGIELPSVPERLARFEEACRIVRSLFDQDRTTFDGSFYSLRDAPNEPKPVQRPFPLLVGGGGERVTLRIAATYGNEWNTWGTPDVMRRKGQILDGHCERVGRDPAEIWRSAQALFVLDSGDDDFAVRRRALEATSLPVIAGPAALLQEAIGDYAAAGISELIVHDMALRGARDRLELLAELDREVFAPFAAA